MHNIPLSPTPKAHDYICADCGRETTIATDDPGLGLCGRCECRLNLKGGNWNKNAPADLEVGCQAAGARVSRWTQLR